MKIQVLDVKTSTKTSVTGKPYQNVEIAFKNIDQGKVESKNLTEYSKVFKQVAEAIVTKFYDVATEKDAKGYWQWTSFTLGEPAEAPSAPTSFKPDPAKANAVPKSNYETADERAARQVLIVKQSCLAQSVAYYNHPSFAKQNITEEHVLNIAQVFVDWVFSEKKAEVTNLFNVPNDLEVE